MPDNGNTTRRMPIVILTVLHSKPDAKGYIASLAMGLLWTRIC